MDHLVDNAVNEIRNITFAGFTGVDECGDKNIAMTNGMAGRGKGYVGKWESENTHMQTLK